ncbi:MAG: hypothetical protein PHX60_07030 [Giesbergeria sp.]|uniref:hypothetical protein n=1 Tax=Giesbergeria sp. TaxID=2818473 RepID=UPI002603ACCF|nr:hypothetical protein [Giesbergeria sp.]MDD2609439.1 hypothetical protein [Giesbergeria sp.]
MKTMKKCACCGSDAGKWEQWHNQDTGCCLCRKCADWIAGRTMFGKPDPLSNPLEFSATYGLPGTHLEPHYYRHFGRNFAIVAEFPDTAQGTIDANKFMERFSNNGLLAVSDGRIIIANMDDLGDWPETAAVASAPA